MKALIDEALALSRRCVDLAEQGDWEAFLAQESRRQKVIRSLEVVDIDASDADSTRSKFEELVSLNDRLQTLCERERGEMVAKIREMQQGGKARKAYGE